MRRKSRKKPCRICRKWFSPDPRVGDRQKTCGKKECQRKWHAKKCGDWNRKHQVYFREVYLARKLQAVTKSEPQSIPPQGCSSWKRQIPSNVIKEVISLQQLVIIEYVFLLLLRRFQGETIIQLSELIEEPSVLSLINISRGDIREHGT